MTFKSILTSNTAIAACLLLGACSNTEDGFYVADPSQLSLVIAPQSTMTSSIASDKKLSVINAVGGNDRVYVHSKSNWTVEVMNDTKPSEHTEWTLYIDEIVNNGEESYFTFSSSINIKNQREWPDAIKIYVPGLDGEELVPQYLSVRQEVSLINLTPASFDRFPASGGGGSINVETSGDWSVTSSAEYTETLTQGWIQIDRSRQAEGVVTFSILANRGTSPRSSTIEFLDGTGKTIAEVPVSQEESSTVFNVYISEGGALISQGGGEVTINVLSDKGWKVESAQAGSNGWLTIEGLGQEQQATTSGDNETERQIKVQVAPNDAPTSRQAMLVFSRTTDAATATSGGVASISLQITQSGTAPFLAAPWVDGIYTPWYVSIASRYMCEGAAETGIEIRKADDGGNFVQIPGGTGIVGVQETGLIQITLMADTEYRSASGDVFRYEPSTRYEMRAYLDNEAGHHTSSTSTFTSPTPQQ